jgi:PAS domain S-box-containing protein
VSERALRSVEATRPHRAALEPTVSDDERARRAVWVQRSDWLEALARRENAYTSGERVWRVSEPWLAALAELAQDPSVILAELSSWARLLDRHSSVWLQVSGSDTEICWSNVPGFPPDSAECEFRLGALRALLRSCSGEETVSIAHVECAARGGERCRFEVLDWIACRDVRHERAFREASLLAADLEGHELVARRLQQLVQRPGPLPDVHEIAGVRRFMEELEDIILVLDRDLWVLDANRAALQFSGMTLSELRGQSAQDLLFDASWRAVREVLPRLFEVGALRGIQLDVRTRSGAATLEVSARVSANGDAIVCVARDVTERLRLERELAERNAQLREQNERIADADRLKSEFLANVSHELNTPLTSIRGFAKLLRADATAEGAGGSRLAPAQRAEFLSLVERESARMTELIQGLLDLSNLEAGGVTLARAPVALSALVEECLQIMKPRLDDSGLEVERFAEPAVPTLSLDPDRMKQVVLNLFENAAKFSPRGARIRVSTRCADGAVELRVANACRELHAQDLGRIFERFVQRDGSYSRKFGGVGLGLNVVRAIVELHGGRVWAELPEPGRVEFIARLPLSE